MYVLCYSADIIKIVTQALFQNLHFYNHTSCSNIFFFHLVWSRELKVFRCSVRTIHTEDVKEWGAVGNIWTQRESIESPYNNCVIKKHYDLYFLPNVIRTIKMKGEMDMECGIHGTER